MSDLWLFGARLIWTAHLFSPAAAESFLHIKQWLIRTNARSCRRVNRIHEAARHGASS